MDGSFVRQGTLVYADASFSPSCRHVYGYGVCMVRRDVANFTSGMGTLPRLFGDNHLAELFASIHGLNAALDAAEHGEQIRLFSDSVNALCVIAGHVPVRVEGSGDIGHGYRGANRFNVRLSPVRTLNPVAVEALDRLRSVIRERRLVVTVGHIKAHTGRKGEAYSYHDECDLIAKAARWHAEKWFNRGRLVSK